MRYAKIGSYVPLGITGAFLLLAIIDAIRLRTLALTERI